ncbi:MAG: DUF1538 domain-containing protein [Cyanobacteria bacterium NC_groundwater_1444_Ag_S-0.65um_54_12]|nr:DUF1538 domain-containing protein [Cyanobacteria bacterium NC_groundwater_1444_Ag_S-0.65um_54_12]
MVSFREAMGLIVPYARRRVVEQIKAVAIIVIYLIFFQSLVLGIPIAEASVIALGLSLVVFGLTFFMEGLVLGLMPLGEVIGIKLPQKSKLPVILSFAFILGMGATFAEPAVGILKAAGSSVKAWEAPLLFMLLNKHSTALVYAVGIGVGVAVVAGMLRFLFNWSLKPFIYGLTLAVAGISVWCYFDPNLIYITGLAWDCGGVTTGPVTVPLVLALGIGVCRVVGSKDSAASGFGVVTLASLFPVLSVLILGLSLAGAVPKPLPQAEFLSSGHRSHVEVLFEDQAALTRYVLENASPQGQLAYFDGNAAALDAAKVQSGTSKAASQLRTPLEVLRANTIVAWQAIIPLSLFMLLILVGLLREKLPRADEIALGIAFAVVGMTIFNIGIELGLAKLGNQVGNKLPSAYQAILLPEEARTIPDFAASLVQRAVGPDGKVQEFYYRVDHHGYKATPFEANQFDQARHEYNYVPTRGPLFGGERGIAGIAVVLVFAFVMGYGATLAEPALNALGGTVEQITVGTFKKTVLMQAVALGVGVGIALGVAKIIWDLPLVWLLVPPYLALMLVSWMSTEEFVNIGWDSAGVTTGPITVPLVLAMGLGIGGQAGVVEGFGILAMASVCPILSVLGVGLVVTKRRQAALAETGTVSKDTSLNQVIPAVAKGVPQT